MQLALKDIRLMGIWIIELGQKCVHQRQRRKICAFAFCGCGYTTSRGRDEKG